MQNWPSESSPTSQNNTVESTEVSEKKILLDALIKSKNPEEAKRILQQYNTQRDDYEKMAIDTDTILFDADQKPINRDPNNYALQELAYNLGIHENVSNFTKQRIQKLTRQVYDDVINNPTRATIAKYENFWQSLFIGNEYLPLWTNIRTLSYNLHDIAQSKGTPTELTTRKRIEKSIGIYDDTQVREFQTQKDNPGTPLALAYKLIDLINNNSILRSTWDELIQWYQENAPAYFRDKALTMIQVARNIATNQPKYEYSIRSWDYMKQGLYLWTGNSTSNQLNITPAANTTDDGANNLYQEILLNTLLQSFESNQGKSQWLGNDMTMAEYHSLTEEQKKALTDWSPKKVYEVLLSRYIESLNGGNVGKPKEIVDGIRKILKNPEQFWLADKPYLMSMYEEIFWKFFALVNSGITDTDIWKQAIQWMIDTINTEDDMNHLLQEFNKSITTRWWFGLDEKNNLKFHSAYSIKQKLKNQTPLSTWDIQALRWYFADIQNSAGARTALSSIIGNTPLDQSTFAEFLDKNTQERNKLISDESYQVLQWYFQDQGFTKKNTDEIKRVPIATIQEQYDIDFNTLFDGIPWVNKIDTIPINADGTPNLPILLESLLQQNISLASCLKVKNILEWTLSKLIWKNSIELTQKRAELMRLFPELWTDPKVSDIFQKIWLGTHGTIDTTLLSLEQATEDTLREYQKKLEEKKRSEAEWWKVRIIDALLGYIKSIKQSKSLQKSYTAITGIEVVDLQKASEQRDTKNFVNSAIGANWAKDIPKKKDELNSIIQQNSELLKRHGLPTNIEEYYNNQNLGTKIADILASSNLTLQEKTVLESIRDRTESLKAKEKSIVSAVEGLKTWWYTASLVNFSDATEFIQSIPPERLAQYQRELWIDWASILSYTPGQIVSLSTLTPGTSTPLSSISGIGEYPHLTGTQVIKKWDNLYELQIQDSDGRKQYALDNIKEGELDNKLQDANTLSELKAEVLIPHIDMIRNLIPMNTRLQSIKNTTDDTPQKTLQLREVVRLLLGKEKVEQSEAEQIRTDRRDTTSRDNITRLMSRGIMSDGGTMNYPIFRSIILEQSLPIGQMTDDDVLRVFLPEEGRQKISKLIPDTKTEVLSTIRHNIQSLRLRLGEVNSQTLWAYRQALSAIPESTKDA